MHAETGANVLKAQHPEFEMWNQGIHARSGVTCADCHMPYKRVGALKISDHHVRSPLLNINRACQTCHQWSEDELRDRADTIQNRTFTLRNQALDALVGLINDLKAAKDAPAAGANLALARDLQRKAQFRVDFIEAENSMGFHAPQEAARILAESINLARQGQIVIRDPSFKPTEALTGPQIATRRLGGAVHAPHSLPPSFPVALHDLKKKPRMGQRIDRPMQRTQLRDL